MLWLVFGIYMGLYFRFGEATLGHSFAYRPKGWMRQTLRLVYSLWAVPGVGGFVVVGQMLREYGSCRRVL